MPDSPLIPYFQSQGVALTTRADGVSTPAHFGNPAAEEQGAAQSVILADLSPRAILTLTGRDRAKFLHNFCTQEIKALTPGQATEAFVSTIQGKVLAHVLVFVDQEAIWIEAAADKEAALSAHLNKYIITEDVEVTSRSAEFAVFYLAGGNLSNVLSSLGIALPAESKIGSSVVTANGVTLSLHRVPWTGNAGWELLVPVAAAQSMWQKLVESGATPIGWQTFSLLRIQAGTPWDGVDLTPEHLAPEAARTARAISYRKGCYLGQEPIARIDSMGHVNQELRVLAFPAGTPVLPVGSELYDADKAVGQVTSSATSAVSGEAFVLAYVRRSHITPGSSVVARIGAENFTATVTDALPAKS